VQIHGGYGTVRDFAAERHLRDVRVTTLHEGTQRARLRERLAPPPGFAKILLVRKIILEILLLLWKALRVVLWKWLRPILGKVAFYAAVAVGLVLLIVMIVSRM
jgi:hypothetical protein